MRGERKEEKGFYTLGNAIDQLVQCKWIWTMEWTNEFATSNTLVMLDCNRFIWFPQQSSYPNENGFIFIGGKQTESGLMIHAMYTTMAITITT